MGEEIVNNTELTPEALRARLVKLERVLRTDVEALAIDNARLGRERDAARAEIAGWQAKGAGELEVAHRALYETRAELTAALRERDEARARVTALERAYDTMREDRDRHHYGAQQNRAERDAATQRAEAAEKLYAAAIHCDQPAFRVLRERAEAAEARFAELEQDCLKVVCHSCQDTIARAEAAESTTRGAALELSRVSRELGETQADVAHLSETADKWQAKHGDAVARAESAEAALRVAREALAHMARVLKPHGWHTYGCSSRPREIPRGPLDDSEPIYAPPGRCDCGAEEAYAAYTAALAPKEGASNER